MLDGPSHGKEAAERQLAESRSAQTSEAQILVDLQIVPETGLSADYANKLMPIFGRAIMFGDCGSQGKLDAFKNTIDVLPSYTAYLAGRITTESAAGRSAHMQCLIDSKNAATEQAIERIERIDQAVEVICWNVGSVLERPSINPEVNREAVEQLVVNVNVILEAVYGGENGQRMISRLSSSLKIDKIADKLTAIANRRLGIKEKAPDDSSSEA